MNVQQGNQLFIAAVAALTLLTAPAAFAESSVRSPLTVAGKTWNGGFAGQINAAPGGKAITTRVFSAPVQDSFAGPVIKGSSVVVQAGTRTQPARAASGVQYAGVSAARSFAN